MSQKPSDNVRARDDTHLRQLVSETREWMQTQGIEEQAVDWEAIAREEEARWWRERLRQALGELAARSREFTESIAARLQQLATATESQAEAALEVTFDAVQQVGRVLFAPAQACLRPGAALQFDYAPVGMRAKLGLGAGQEESVGVFLSSVIPGARVFADAHQHTIMVEFWEPVASPLVVLVPENPELVPHVAEVVKVDDTARAVFANLPLGRYLLSIYALEGEKP